MTVHKTDSKGAKSKIILPIKPSTKLLPKNKKITASLNKVRKFIRYFYNKIQINTILASLKIQNVLVNLHKVHSPLV